MNLRPMPRDAGWWVWLVTVGLLVAGLAGHDGGFLGAIALSFSQVAFYWAKQRRLGAMAVQIRLGYALLLAACFAPPLRWLYWLPAIGTTALLVFGYCLMARTLSLLPWNRREPMSLGLVRRTFLTPPAGGGAGSAAGGCGGEGGVCELEARVAWPRPAGEEPAGGEGRFFQTQTRPRHEHR